ncbi:MAG TPA: hypothetical protein H9726_07570, partial [Candidatus Borkfalkia avicola]|nr:hypothetical protein [Candidatus Borkfalkia avicola]
FTYNYKDGTETITLSELESAKSSDIKCVGAPQKQHRLLSVLFLLCVRSRLELVAPKVQAVRARCALPPQGAKLLKGAHLPSVPLL